MATTNFTLRLNDNGTEDIRLNSSSVGKLKKSLETLQILSRVCDEAKATAAQIQQLIDRVSEDGWYSPVCCGDPDCGHEGAETTSGETTTEDVTTQEAVAAGAGDEF